MPPSCPPLNRVCDQRLAGQWRRSGWGRVCAEGLQARWSQSAAQERSLAPPPWGSCDGHWTTTPHPPQSLMPRKSKVGACPGGSSRLNVPQPHPGQPVPGLLLSTPPPRDCLSLVHVSSLSPGEGTPHSTQQDRGGGGGAGRSLIPGPSKSGRSEGLWSLHSTHHCSLPQGQGLRESWKHLMEK